MVWGFISGNCLILTMVTFQAASKNVSDSISGWIFGVFAFTQFVSSPLAGHLVRIQETQLLILNLDFGPVF